MKLIKGQRIHPGPSFQEEEEEGKKMGEPGQAFLPSTALLVLLLLTFSHVSDADVGSGSFYDPPYLPTACYRNDPNQFPAGNKFAAAGEGIWDNGAACGRQYLVECLGADVTRACISATAIQVKIVDRASTLVSNPPNRGATMILSAAVFQQIANRSLTNEINIEFRQV